MDILFQDRRIVVAVKPCGVVTPPSIFFRLDIWGDLLS